MTTVEQPWINRFAVTLAVGLTVFGGLVPGLGLLLGIVFSRVHPGHRRMFLVLGIVMTVVSVVMMLIAFGIGSTESSTSQNVPV